MQDVHNNLFGDLAGRENGLQVILGVVGVEFKGAGDVALLVMVRVAGVNKHNQVHLPARVVEETFHAGAIQELQAVFLEPRGERVGGRRRWGGTLVTAGGCEARTGGAGAGDGLASPGK